MMLSKSKLILINFVILLVCVLIIPVVPVGKLLFTDAQVVSLFPYDYYLIKDDSPASSFGEYLEDRGWIYSHEGECGYYYSKGNQQKYITRDMIITMYFRDSNVGFWKDMMTVLSFPKFLLYIAYPFIFIVIIFLLIITYKRLKC
ncbi:hypothetical protein PV797_16010 [Clostridiaceae bacterium M8S5]|nr:hypothetical protein PV797_16010 [Clostridiaceae bacterium M8S5]